MSGGIAYVYDPDEQFASMVNYEMVALEPLEEHECDWLREVVERHRDLTESTRADCLLNRWERSVRRFRKVMPQDYKRVLSVLREAEEQGLPEEDTLVRVMAAAHG
jgi:glutamate synthase (NADPH/NADH) large chain